MATPNHSTSTRTTPSARAGPRLLLVDTNANIAAHCRRLLEREGYQVQVTDSPAVVLQIFDQAPPDLVVLDVRQPKLDGLSLLEHLCRIAPSVPVVLYASHRDFLDDARAGLASGRLEKNEDLSELKETISGLLARNQR